MQRFGRISRPCKLVEARFELLVSPRRDQRERTGDERDAAPRDESGPGTGGAAGCCIEEVAARAGVNKTSIYRRWVTPERLVIDMFERGAARHDPPDTGSLRQDLVAHLTAFERFREEPITLAIVRMIAASALRGELSALVKKLGDRDRRDVMRIFERGVARGELPRGASAEMGYQLVHALGLELALSDRAEGEGKSPRRVHDLVEIVLLGLANLALREPGRAGARR